MRSRNLNPMTMFEQMALEHRPSHHFAGSTIADFESWKCEVLPKVIATLGRFPEEVSPNPELIAQWEEDGLVKQRWVMDVGKYISAILLVNIPSGMSEGEKRPAILCWHGHGEFGKDSVMGNDSSEDRRREIHMCNYAYGRTMAQAGFVTYAIDWMGIGERNPSVKPNWRVDERIHDWCDVFYLNATMLGTTAISMNVAQGMAATNFVCTLPFVDADRLGVMGLSGGGTMTTWTMLCDDRFKAAEIICYTDLWAHFGFRDANYCGMQVAPGLFEIVDLPDLQGLIARKPLLIDLGIYDTCFKIDSTLAAYKQVERIYNAAGAFDLLELDMFVGEHSWGGNKSIPFFSNHLATKLDP